MFDSNGVYMGGTADPASAPSYAFFINPIVSGAVPVNSNGCIAVAADAETGCIYPPPFVAGELLSYTDDASPGNVSAPILVGFDDWLQFKFLFAGQNAQGGNRIYAVNQDAQLLSYGDDGVRVTSRPRSPSGSAAGSSSGSCSPARTRSAGTASTP